MLHAGHDEGVQRPPEVEAPLPFEEPDEPRRPPAEDEEPPSPMGEMNPEPPVDDVAPVPVPGGTPPLPIGMEGVPPGPPTGSPPEPSVTGMPPLAVPTSPPDPTPVLPPKEEPPIPPSVRPEASKPMTLAQELATRSTGQSHTNLGRRISKKTSLHCRVYLLVFRGTAERPPLGATCARGIAGKALDGRALARAHRRRCKVRVPRLLSTSPPVARSSPIPA
jgi:hypothetical protein